MLLGLAVPICSSMSLGLAWFGEVMPPSWQIPLDTPHLVSACFPDGMPTIHQEFARRDRVRTFQEENQLRFIS